jgi:hypothetical protein
MLNHELGVRSKIETKAVLDKIKNKWFALGAPLTLLRPATRSASDEISAAGDRDRIRPDLHRNDRQRLFELGSASASDVTGRAGACGGAGRAG